MQRIYDDLQLFCAVVEHGSLKAASDSLNIPHSTVSRRINALENSLGLSLLQRTTREVKVTPRGHELYLDCHPVFETLKQSIGSAIDAEIMFKGRLNVSMPVRAGLDFLGQWLIDFAKLHADLQLDLSLSNSNKNLVKDDIDLAFRVGPLADSSAIALRLWDIPYTLCAHSSFVTRYGLTHATISQEQLMTLPCVVSRPAVKWAFVDERDNPKFIQPSAALTVDDLALALHAVESGQYMAMMPTSMLNNDDIKHVVLHGLAPRTRVMYAYYLGRRHAQSQIKKLVDYIKVRHAQSLRESTM